MNQKKIVELARKHGVLRARDLNPYGIPREYLRRLCDKGLLERVARGLYRLPDSPVTENHTLAETCKRVPRGVVCLLSALQYHGLTTQTPHQVWVAIGRKDRRPSPDCPPLRIVRFSGAAMTEGVETHAVEAVPVRIFSPAKTVADCFKYRNKIGVDVALEALKECWRDRRCTMDDLWRYAKICRVQNVIRPYLESLVP
ncbi:MAG: type IV toxin-antitoxin system AbiEi family antitoxin domain-containing protein [Candidatus Eisenbacteria bacterium]|nr:type IV toxin-antitoxin system AbiEi family antitoxin domain-containing protein [Candidatus Eisenbacteria bacterium]